MVVGASVVAVVVVGLWSVSWCLAAASLSSWWLDVVLVVDVVVLVVDVVVVVVGGDEGKGGFAATSSTPNVTGAFVTLLERTI